MKRNNKTKLDAEAIVISGPPASGKSVMARMVSNAYDSELWNGGVPIIELDELPGADMPLTPVRLRSICSRYIANNQEPIVMLVGRNIDDKVVEGAGLRIITRIHMQPSPWW